MSFTPSNSQYTVFLGSARQVGSTCVLSGSNSSDAGGYKAELDFSPNSVVSFQCQASNWGMSTFRFDLMSDAQTLRYSFPNSNVLRLSDTGGTALQNWTLSNSSVLSNAPGWTDMQVTSMSSNLIATVNGSPYFAAVPGWEQPEVRTWANGAFMWSASNAGFPGVYSVRNIYAQGVTNFDDPVNFNYAVTAGTINADKIGVADLRCSNATMLNASMCNIAASNISAGNLGTAAFCNVIPYSMVSGAPVNVNFNYVTSSNLGCGTAANSNYGLDVSGTARVTGALTVGTISASNLGTAAFCNVIPYGMLTGVPAGSNLGSASGTSNGLLTASDWTRFNAGSNWTNISGKPAVLDEFSEIATGTARIGNLTCSNISASNLGTAAFCNVIPSSMVSGLVAGSNFSTLSTSSLVVSNNAYFGNQDKHCIIRLYDENGSYNGAASNYNGFGCDRDYLGLGLWQTTNRYQVRGNLDRHGFYGGSNELVRIEGDGDFYSTTDTFSIQHRTGAPTTLYINSTGASGTTSVIQYVNNGHYTACTDTVTYDGIPSAVTSGHQMYYKSGGHTFEGTVLVNSGAKIGNGLKVGANGDTINKIYRGYVTVPTTSDNERTVTVTFAGGGAGFSYSVFLSSHHVSGSYYRKTLEWTNATSSGTNNSFDVKVKCVDNDANLNANTQIHWMVVAFP